jgi:uncharacterized protein with HEPN domain
MPSKSPLVPLSNIKHNILLAQQFMSELSTEMFRAGRRTVYAVTRCLEIISEASRKLPLELKQRHPNIPWRDMAGAGSVYRRDYEEVSDEQFGILRGKILSPCLPQSKQNLQGLEARRVRAVA